MAAVGFDARSRMSRLRRQMILLGKGLWQRRPRRDVPRTYVFVAGMQRSGTNMVMDVLERSLVTDVYHETDSRAFDRFEMRHEAVIKELAAASPAPFFIIKALCELDRIPTLMNTFAPSKTLWVVRDMEDVVNSATRSFRNFPAQLERIVNDRNDAQWRGRGMSDDTHALIRSLYHPKMSEATAAALTWYYRNILYFENGLDRNQNVLLVSYERLVGSPESEFRELFRFLGIPYSRWISRLVFASSVKRRAPPDVELEVRTLCRDLQRRFQDAGI